MADGLRLALTTLTVLPVRGPTALDRRTAGAAMACAPLVGLLLGLVAAGVLLGARLLGLGAGGALLPAVLAVATLAALTRGLHLDGLADTADGLASYLPPERARAVMKAPDVGALGMVTVVLVLAVQAAALAACVQHGRGTVGVVLAAVLGRTAVALACTPPTPAASPDGLGALVVGTVRPALSRALVVLVGVGAALVELLADERGPGAHPLLDAGRALLAVALGLLAARALRRHAVRRLGGVNGDVLGALVEVTATVVLVVMAVQPHT